MQILSRINWLDIVVLSLMLRISYVAARDGLSHEIFPFFGSLALLVFSLHYYKIFGSFLSHDLGNIPAEISNFASFLMIVVVFGFVIKFIKIVLNKMVQVQWHPAIEQIGGLIAGIAKAYIITAIVLIVFALVPFSYFQWSIRDKSLTGQYVLRAGPEIYSRVVKLLPSSMAGSQAVDKEAMFDELLSDKTVVFKAPPQNPLL